MSREAQVALRRWTGSGLRHLVLLILVVATFYPIYLMLITSVKNNTQFYQNFGALLFPLQWQNYGVAWQEVSQYILNSALVTIGTVVGVIICSTLAAYAFARLSFVGKEILYYMIIVLMMIPGVLTLVPQFVLMRNFGLIDSLWALILPYISGGIAFASGGVSFAVFVLRGFFDSLPDELFQAARIDGASERQVFWYLALPLIRPAVATVAILQILSTWNDYIWPSVTLYSNAVFTIPIGLVAFETHHTTDWGPLMASYTLAAVPLVTLFALTTRTFVDGLTQGGLKL